MVIRINLFIFLFSFFLYSCKLDNKEKLTNERNAITVQLPPRIPDSAGMQLNDIALKYWGHQRRDSSIRIWYWQHSDIDSGGNYKIHLFEYGINKFDSSSIVSNIPYKNKSYYALFSVFEIEGRPFIDKYWEVKSLSTKYINPKGGWDNLEKVYKMQNLDKIYLIPDVRQSSSPTSSVSHLSLEYIFGDRIETLVFTAQHAIYQSNFPRDTSFVKLMALINNQFGLDINPFY